MIDLHIHSYFSDGTFSPAEICRMSQDLSLQAIALTDHDTIDGIEEFMNSDTHLTKIPGLEISLDFPDGTFHLLGLNVDYKNRALINSLEELKKFRKARNEKLLQLISELVGKEITETEISSQNKGELGRPHIAKFLIKMGYARTINEAFDTFLGKGKKFYVEKMKLSIENALKVIKDSGGKTVLAHPVTLNLDNKRFISFVDKLTKMGLDGIEAFCPLHSTADCNFYSKTAKRFNLIVTAGSDFHGSNKGEIYLGNVGKCTIDSENILKNLIYP